MGVIGGGGDRHHHHRRRIADASLRARRPPRVDSDAHRRLHHLCDRQPAAALRRSVLHRGEAHHRRRRRGLRRDLRGDVRTAHGGGDGHRCRRSAGDRCRPESDRAAVAADVLERLLPATRPDAGRGDERDRDGLLGHRRQGRRQAGVRPARRAGPRTDPHLHVPVSRRRPTGRVHRSGAGGRAGGVRGGSWVHGRQVRSGWPVHRVRRAPAEPRGHRPVGGDHRRDPRRSRLEVPTCCSAPTASSPRQGRFASLDGWSRSIRCGSRNRPSPTSPRRWRGSHGRRRSPLRPASG